MYSKDARSQTTSVSVLPEKYRPMHETDHQQIEANNHHSNCPEVLGETTLRKQASNWMGAEC